MDMHVNSPTMPSLSETLADMAVLARVKCTALGATRRDKAISAEIDRAKEAPDGTTSANIKRLAGAEDLHNAICGVQKQAQQNLIDHCMPWGDGYHLLPNANFESWIGKHYALQQEHDKLQQELVDNGHKIIEVATRSLAKIPTVKPPTYEELTRAYTMEYKVAPIPPAAFPKMLPGVEELLKEQYEAGMQAQYHKGSNAALARLIEPLEKLVKGIEKYDTKDERETKTVFKNCILENVQEVLDVLPSLNLTGDPVMKAFIEQCKLFQTVAPEDIKKNDGMRNAVKTRAQETIEALSGWLGKMPE